MQKPLSKQAVVLIHGIGEQVPMDTLRGFVQAVWATDAELRLPGVPSQLWSKPDEVSGNYELRRFTTAEAKNGKRTDFYELYWADLMEGTKWSHVTAWLFLLLFRSPRRVPKQLRGIWGTTALLTVAVPTWFLLSKLGVIALDSYWVGVIGGAGVAIWGLANALLLDVAGDAARYLHIAPKNIARRRAIREAGLQLLRKLNDSPSYDRVIVVGHSLGSVVGYDILTHLWPAYNKLKTEKAHPGGRLDLTEELAREKTLDADAYQAAQTAYSRTPRAAGNRWIVTDFVTLGSPLAHAAFLLARAAEEFERKKVERELPTCPPVLETVGPTKRVGFCFITDDGRWVPHHGAVFGPTRWTNLYFPCRFTLGGDVIGGPMQPAFGPGIKDIRVDTSIRWGLLAHTHYWSFPKKWTPQTAVPAHIVSLRKILDLNSLP